MQMSMPTMVTSSRHGDGAEPELFGSVLVVVVDSARIEEILLLPISRHCLRATNFLLRAKTWAGRVRKWREDNIWRRRI